MGIEMGSDWHPWEMRRAREWLAGQAPVVEVDGWHVEPTGANEPAVVEETIADLAALLRDAWGSGHLAAAGDELAAERRGYERGYEQAASQARRLYSKIRRVADSGCWEWTAACDRRGYGRIQIGSRDTGQRFERAHRVSYRLHHGEIPDGMYVCHRCDNPPCVNPKHLFAASPTGNARDRNMKGREARGPRNARSKLDADKVRDIRRRWPGETCRAIAESYGVDQKTIRQVINGVTWRHVPNTALLDEGQQPREEG